MKQSDSTERDEIFVIFDKDRKARGYVLPTARSTNRTAGGLSPGNTRRQKGRSSMKRRVLSFLAGAAAALALTALTATALAASGQVQFNFAGVALNGETKIAAGSGTDMVIANGDDVGVIWDILEGREVGTLFTAHRSPDFTLLDYIESVHP